ncbi:hypothetical protein Pmani_012833 [Petrolisthes manimaculis]|uniref:Uncharacterized protein n=1 Tax=Petrolisthes manimaculis TaxID=1843537 RepID=A0AAE1UE85_9EUCA|nr:hypothetical protein Pmani_012833 [Petrolisthes manimaculis]
MSFVFLCTPPPPPLNPHPPPSHLNPPPPPPPPPPPLNPHPPPSHLNPPPPPPPPPPSPPPPPPPPPPPSPPLPPPLPTDQYGVMMDGVGIKDQHTITSSVSFRGLYDGLENNGLLKLRHETRHWVCACDVIGILRDRPPQHRFLHAVHTTTQL